MLIDFELSWRNSCLAISSEHLFERQKTICPEKRSNHRLFTKKSPALVVEHLNLMIWIKWFDDWFHFWIIRRRLHHQTNLNKFGFSKKRKGPFETANWSVKVVFYRKFRPRHHQKACAHIFKWLESYKILINALYYKVYRSIWLDFFRNYGNKNTDANHGFENYHATCPRCYRKAVNEWIF